MESWFSHASGIIISTECGRDRPPRCRSSRTSSKEAESEASGRADREDPVEALSSTEQVGDELGLAGHHPVAVALDRVDLAVVRDEAVRVGERPAREGVRGEPGVHERDRGGEAAVGQVREEGLQLAGGQHALVDDGPGGERREVHVGLALGALAQHERLAVEIDARGWNRRRRRAGGRRASSSGRWRRAVRGRPGPRASRGPSGPLRRRSSRSARRRRRWRPPAGRRYRRRTSPPRAARIRPPRGRRCPGTWERMPAPSPESGSEPVAPRCSRLRSTVSACSTSAWLASPVRVATKPTPQASCSLRGSYIPCAAGRASMNDQFWPFAECWDGWRGVRIGSPVVVVAYASAEGRRWPSASAKFRAGYMMEPFSGTGYAVPACGHRGVAAGVPLVRLNKGDLFGQIR